MSPVQTSSSSSSATSSSKTNTFTPDDESSVYKYDLEVIQERDIASPIHPIIAARRSTRAMIGGDIDDAVLRSIFEASRWCPSYFNSQPWRFVYSKRGDAHWAAYVDAMNEKNRAWGQDAAVLVVALSKRTVVKPSPVGEITSPMHSFDAGAAWMAMALEATARGLVVHALYGIDFEKTAAAIGLAGGREDARYKIECMIVIGHRGVRADGRPEPCTPRHPVEHFVSAGRFDPK